MTTPNPLPWFVDDASRALYQNLCQGALPHPETETPPEYSHRHPPSNRSKKIQEAQETQKQIQRLDVNHLDSVVIYGAGAWGRQLFHLVFSDRPQIQVLFCDQKGDSLELFCYCDVITPAQLVAEYRHLPVIVAMKNHQESVGDFLQAHQVAQVYFFALERGEPHQAVDLWCPELETQEDYVWVGNFPQSLACCNLILSSAPIPEQAPEPVFLQTPLAYESFLPEPERSHYIKKLPTESGGVLIRSPQKAYKFPFGASIHPLHLDDGMVFRSVSTLKVHLCNDTIPFFQGAKDLVSANLPQLAVTIPWQKDNGSVDTTTLDWLLQWLNQLVPQYVFFLDLNQEKTLLFYAVLKEPEHGGDL